MNCFDDGEINKAFSCVIDRSVEKSELGQTEINKNASEHVGKYIKSAKQGIDKKQKTKKNQ